MRKGDINWESFGQALLWRTILIEKNKDSGYDIMTEDVPERNMKKGDIGAWRILSYIGPFSHKPLTWKELALELGLFEEFLTPDGHDCKKCPDRKNCHAYFKDDEDQERCNWWEQNMNKENG